jgi:D-alanyl-D-alanine carboxypeptidase (penicillin-binding protein 5/6)
VVLALLGGAVGAPAADAAPVPPPAPAPTSSEQSPGAPDPSPPLGGLDANGRPVGGATLLRRDITQAPGTPPLPDNLTAQSWILADLDTGDVLAARDPHGRYQPASILKVLTCLVLLPQLTSDRTVVVSAVAASTEGSAVGLVPGGTYGVDDLFSGLLLMSGNDTAAALAEAAGGVNKTVAAMNALAAQLGMVDTFVETPSGLDGWSQLTSAYDMALVLREAVADTRFLQLDSQLIGALPGQKVGDREVGPIPLGNQGAQFLTDVPGALIAKSGFTDAARNTYLAATQRGGRRLGVVFLRNQRYPLDQWQQAAKLLDWGYALPVGAAPIGKLGTSTVVRTTSPAPLPTRSPNPAATPGTASAAAPSPASSAHPTPEAGAAGGGGGNQASANSTPAPLTGGAPLGAYLIALLGLAVAVLCATTLRRALQLAAVAAGRTSHPSARPRIMQPTRPGAGGGSRSPDPIRSTHG